MARMPAANWLGEHSPRVPMSRYDIVCVHTIVGFAPAHAAHFSTHDDGQIDQSRDTEWRSAANLNGNHRVIAIENEDAAKNIPLSDAQVTACARILAWAHRVHGVPLQLCPDSRPGSRGLAVHRQGIDGNFVVPDRSLGLPLSMWRGRGTLANPGRWVPDGEIWTETPGKECPRNVRIAQVPEILARAQLIVEGEWFEMATKAELREVVDEALAAERDNQAQANWNVLIGPEGSTAPARDRLRGADFNATSANAAVVALAAEFEEYRTGTRNRQAVLIEKLNAIAADTSDDATKADLDAAVAELKAATP